MERSRNSLILSGEMLLRYLSWTEAADLVIEAVDSAIRNRTVTADFAYLMDKATLLPCSAFADAIVANMQ